MRRATIATTFASTLALAAALVVSPGFAQAAPQPAAPAGDAKPSAVQAADRPPPTPEKMEEARQRFKRGLELFDEKNYEAARVELERAYELAPTWRLLYNIGQCYAQRGDYVEAVKDLERYVAEGKAEVSAERRAEVAKALESLRPRIAAVTIKTNVPDVDISLDDQPVGKVTSAPILVNPGRRKFGASKPGYVADIKVITPAGSDKVDLVFDLKEEAKRIVINQGTDVKPIAAWAVAGAFVVGAGVTGYLALKASSDRQDTINTRDVTADQINKALTKQKTFAIVSDVLSIGAVLSIGTAVYFTWFNKPKDARAADADKKSALRLRVNPGPGSLLVSGQF